MWQIGALQAAAIESVTLPARLRPVDGRTVLLGDFDMTLNRDGPRKIAGLEYGASNADDLLGDSAASGDSDHRMTNGATDDDRGEEPHTDRFEIGLLPTNEPQGRNSVNGQGRLRDHIFGRVDSLRGAWRPAVEIEESNMASRDRFADGRGLTTITYASKIHVQFTLFRLTVTRHQSSLLFPLLSSFPHIFDINTGGKDRLAIRAALTTSTAIAQRLQYLEQIVRRLASVNIDDRSGLGEALRGMTEEYTEGWDSDLSSDDDDL